MSADPTTIGPHRRARPVGPASVARGAALVALLSLSAVVLRTAPDEGTWQGPIEVRGPVGTELTGRNIEATVEDVRIARSVTASSGWSGETPGIWVVVDVRAAAVVTDLAAGLGAAQLVLGDDTYSASIRPGYASIAEASLETGIPLSGPLLFEVPRGAVTGPAAAHAEIRLAVDDDTRTDSMLVVAVDLTTVATEDAITTEAPVLGVS